MEADLVQGAAKAEAQRIPFDNSYARLPDRFFTRTQPTAVAEPRLLKLNVKLAEELGLDPSALEGVAGARLLSGNIIAEGSTPIATAYAGHQFGQFVPQLGDGRAILLGEVIDRNGQRRDIQLKGAGPTPFSRRGDGRAALGPVLREYLVSEAMHALGIPSTRALAAVLSGEAVYREEVLPGAVLTRVASSHIRVGTFQFFAVRGDTDALKTLADHVIARHYPQLREAGQPYLALLDAVIARQAALVARWMIVGFIHGVMNTDNMSVAGETIDFGPCAFMNDYDPGTVFSSIDVGGRYAYANQPAIAQWNLARFAETLLPLFDESKEKAVEIATERIIAFSEIFNTQWLDGMRRKLGLHQQEEGDRALIESLLELMQAGQADFTLIFRRLADVAEDETRLSALHDLFLDPAAIRPWLDQWRARIARENIAPTELAGLMRSVNPLFIPRNHQVEAALSAALTNLDLGPFETLLSILARPYDEQPEHAAFAVLAPESDTPYRTFCGT